MVDVQMGAEHRVDRLRCDAGGAQPVEPARAGAPVPGRDLRPVLVLADAGIDQDRPPAQAQDEALDREAQHVAGEVDEIRLEPAALVPQRLEVEARQEPAQRQLEIIVVDDHVDGDVADGKAHAQSPSGAVGVRDAVTIATDSGMASYLATPPW